MAMRMPQLFDKLHDCYTEEDFDRIKSLVEPYLKDYLEKVTRLNHVFAELRRRNVISIGKFGVLEEIIKIVPGDGSPREYYQEFRATLAQGTLDFSDDAPYPDRFVGREREKSDCLNFFNSQKHQSPACLFLSGFPGVGKTSLARKICTSFQSSPDIVSLDLREIKDLNSVIRDLVKKIDKGKHTYDMDTLEELIRDFHRKEKEHVVLFDNAEDILNGAYGISHSFMKLVEMLVKAGHPDYLKIIITSRFQNPLSCKRQKVKKTSDLQINIEEKTLDRLNVSDSVKLIEMYCGQANINKEDKEEIARLCGYCAFAMKLVAGRLQNLTLKPRQMIKMLQRSSKSMKRKKTSNISRMESLQDMDPEQRYYQDMKQCIEQAYRLISEEEGKLLIMLSVIPGTFNTKAAAAVTGSRDTEMALKLQFLMYYNLVDVENPTQAKGSASNTPQNVRDRWRLHTLLRMFLSELEKDESQEQAWKEAEENFVRYYAKVVHKISENLDLEYTKAMRDQENEEANIFHFFSLQNEVRHKMVSSLDDPVTTNNVVYLMELMINIPERLRYFERRVKKAAEDGFSRQYAVMRCWEAVQYNGLGEHAAVAKDILEDAYDHLMQLPEEEKKSQEGLLAFAHFYQTWGNVSVGDKDYPTGIEMLKKSLAIRRNMFEGDVGKWGTILVRTLNDLGHAFYQYAQNSHKYTRSALKEAFLYQSEALELRERLSKNHCDTIILYMNLGACYHSMANYEKAIDTYQNALDLDKELHLCTMNNRASILKNMALSLKFLDKFEDGFQLAEEAYEIKKNKDDLRQPARCLYLCGLLQMEQRNYEKAEKYFNMQLELEEKLLVDGRPHSDDWKELQMKLIDLCKIIDKDITSYNERFENAEKNFKTAVESGRHVRVNSRKRKRRVSDSSSSTSDSDSSVRSVKDSKREDVQEINPSVFENPYFKILTKDEVFSKKYNLSECLANDVPGIGKNPRLSVFKSRSSGRLHLPVAGDPRSVIEQAEAVREASNMPLARLRDYLLGQCHIL